MDLHVHLFVFLSTLGVFQLCDLVIFSSYTLTCLETRHCQIRMTLLTTLLLRKSDNIVMPRRWILEPSTHFSEGNVNS